jgi:hypothetical protein
MASVTYLAGLAPGAIFRVAMAIAFHASGDAIPDVCRRVVLRTNPRGAKAECVFTDGTSILLSNLLTSFIHPGDEVRFPLALEAAPVGAEINIRNRKRIAERQEIFQTTIGNTTQPRKDKRGNLYVLSEVVSPVLGVSAIHLRCETLRDYFYVGNRNCEFDCQPSFYELLQSSPKASVTELRLGFRLRSLELRAASKPFAYLATLERAFNILGRSAASDVSSLRESFLETAQPSTPLECSRSCRKQRLNLYEHPCEDLCFIKITRFT